MQHVEVSRLIDGPSPAVFARYCDVPSWNDWARLGAVSLQRPGDADGVGAVRSIRNGPFQVLEEITVSQPPRTLDYRLLRGFPLRNHSGRVTFVAAAGGTRVIWQCDFDSKIPGLGPLFRVLVAGIFARALAGLDADLRANPPRAA